MNVLKEFLNNLKKFLKEIQSSILIRMLDLILMIAMMCNERLIFFFAHARFQTTMRTLSPFAQLLGSESLFEN